MSKRQGAEQYQIFDPVTGAILWQGHAANARQAWISAGYGDDDVRADDLSIRRVRWSAAINDWEEVTTP